MSRFVRIGIYYDGTHFAYASNYYRYHHPRQARISISGFHEYLRTEIAQREEVATNFCQIAEAHYYRGRLPADEVNRQGRLLGERKFEDALARARVKTHFPVMHSHTYQAAEEWGVNASLVIDTMEAAFLKRVDVIVLVTGDKDFVQLAERLGSWGCRVMVAAWDVQSSDGQITLRAAQDLLNVVPYPLLVNTDIDHRTRGSEPFVNNLFVPRDPQIDLMPDDIPDDVHIDEEYERGVVINLPHGRDYGFIAPDRGGENLFFHSSWVGDETGLAESEDLFESLNVGDAVTFIAGENPKTGQPCATDVTVIGSH